MSSKKLKITNVITNQLFLISLDAKKLPKKNMKPIVTIQKVKETLYPSLLSTESIANNKIAEIIITPHENTKFIKA